MSGYVHTHSTVNRPALTSFWVNHRALHSVRRGLYEAITKDG